MWFNQLYDRDKESIEAFFLLDEIKDVVWNNDGDKSPGLGGHSVGFFKKRC